MDRLYDFTARTDCVVADYICRREASSEKGVMDLAGLEWTSQSVIPLDGEWEFYPEQLLTPQQIHHTRVQPIMMQVPGNWDDSSNSQGYPMNGKSYGTYRLLVRNVPQGEWMAIAKRYVRFSDAMYLDGNLINSSGIPGNRRLPMYRAMSRIWSTFILNAQRSKLCCRLLILIFAVAASTIRLI